MSCNTCGCNPCACAPCPSTVLNQPTLISPQVSGGQFTNGVFQSPTILAGTSTGQSIIGATIDCTTIGCTQPPGTNNSTLATTAFVNVAIANAISSLNPAFCDAVTECIQNNPGVTCVAVAACIQTTPGIINTTQAFGPGAAATQLVDGVTRYATTAELLNADCGLSIEPCVLVGAWGSAVDAGPFWTAFTQAVNAVFPSINICAAVDACITTSATLCAAVDACLPGSATFCATGVACGFQTAGQVNAAIAAALAAAITCPAISALWAPAGGNPGGGVGFLANDCQTYTAAQIVAGGGGGGGGAIVVGCGSALFNSSGVPGIDGGFVAPIFGSQGVVVNGGGPGRFIFNVPQPDLNYSVTFGQGESFGPVIPHVIFPFGKQLTHFDFNVNEMGGGPTAIVVDFTVTR